eukprot:COSAG02_NODE_32673_length_512_cov_1.142857_1_plen_20_part_01
MGLLPRSEELVVGAGRWHEQ